jgi:DNA-binding CsgD family transcriptional regulator
VIQITDQQLAMVLRMRRGGKHTAEAIAEATGLSLNSVANIIRAATQPKKTRPPMRGRGR